MDLYLFKWLLGTITGEMAIRSHDEFSRIQRLSMQFSCRIESFQHSAKWFSFSSSFHPCLHGMSVVTFAHDRITINVFLPITITMQLHYSYLCVCMCVARCVCTCVCVCARACESECVHMCTCMCVYSYMCVHVLCCSCVYVAFVKYSRNQLASYL